MAPPKNTREPLDNPVPKARRERRGLPLLPANDFFVCREHSGVYLLPVGEWGFPPKSGWRGSPPPRGCEARRLLRWGEALRGAVGRAAGGHQRRAMRGAAFSGAAAESSAGSRRAPACPEAIHTTISQLFREHQGPFLLPANVFFVCGEHQDASVFPIAYPRAFLPG